MKEALMRARYCLALALFVGPGGDVIVVNKAAIFRLTGGDRTGAAKPSGKEKFVRSGPEPALRLDPSAAAAIDPIEIHAGHDPDAARGAAIPQKLGR